MIKLSLQACELGSLFPRPFFFLSNEMVHTGEENAWGE